MMKYMTIVTLFVAALIASCSFEAAIPKYVFGKDTPPELLDVRAVSPLEMRFTFSEPVTLQTIAFAPEAVVQETLDGDTVVVRFESPYEIGTEVTADLLVCNTAGGTLEAVFTFGAFNDRMPEFLITELRTELSKPRVEFIELYMTTGGNLAGARLFVASNGIKLPVYEFPAVEVREGEYVLLHMRSPDYINAVNEAGEDLAAVTSDDKKVQADCPPTVRDLWLPVNKEVLRKSDVVYVTGQTGRVIDAAAFCDKVKEAGKWDANPAFEEALSFLVEAGAWMVEGGGGIESVFDSNGTTATRTICRREAAGDTNTAQDWYKSATSKASPGKANAAP
jgi:hypothetical protein